MSQPDAGQRAGVRTLSAIGGRKSSQPEGLCLCSKRRSVDVGKRQPHLELGFSRAGFEANAPAVPLDSAKHHVETKAASITDLFGRKERFEHPVLDRCRNAGAVVHDLDQGHIEFPLRADGECSDAIHCLEGVLDEFGPNLIQFAAIGRDSRKASVVLAYYSYALAQLMSQHL